MGVIKLAKALKKKATEEIAEEVVQETETVEETVVEDEATEEFAIPEVIYAEDFAYKLKADKGVYEGLSVDDVFSTLDGLLGKATTITITKL